MTTTHHALLGWLLLALVGGSGSALLATAAAAGASAWPAAAFAALSLLALVVHGARVQTAHRSLLARLPLAEGRLAGLDESLRVALSQLGAGDLPRASAQAEGLPAGIGDTLAAAARALAVLAEQIQDSSIQVAAAADGVTRVASDLASGSSQQSASVVQITAALEELAQTAAQIAANAARQQELAEAARQSGDAGARAVAAGVAGVEAVQARIAEIALRADALSTRAKEIYRVLELITEIAQETHILSLNAAIEAAAAGGEGRRFAVIADEVRRLAHRSQESVDSVRGLLDELAGSIRATIVATEEGGKAATRVVARVRAAAAALATLDESAGATAAAAAQISLATRRQTAASEEVLATLREVGRVVQTMGGGLKEQAATAGRLSRLGLSIQLMAQTFHSESPRSLKHLIEEWARRLQGVERATVAARLDELVQATPFIEMGYLADEAGRVVVLCHSKRLIAAERSRLSEDEVRQLDMRQRPWFRAAAHERRTSLTSLYDSLQSNELCFTVATPLAGPGGVFAGVLGMDVNLTSWMRA